jgi:hypothetical protein
MQRQLAWLKRLDPFILLLIQGVRYACLSGILLCLGAVLLVLWQHGFTGKWRLAVVLFLVFAACFYGQMYQAKRMAKKVRRLTQASA